MCMITRRFHEKTIIIGEKNKFLMKKLVWLLWQCFFRLSGDAIVLRFLICCYPYPKLPEAIKIPFVAICSRFFVYWPDYSSSDDIWILEMLQTRHLCHLLVARGVLLLFKFLFFLAIKLLNVHVKLPFQDKAWYTLKILIKLWLYSWDCMHDIWISKERKVVFYLDWVKAGYCLNVKGYLHWIHLAITKVP
jgi:hypothetical protein